MEVFFLKIFALEWNFAFFVCFLLYFLCAAAAAAAAAVAFNESASLPAGHVASLASWLGNWVAIYLAS